MCENIDISSYRPTKWRILLPTWCILVKIMKMSISMIPPPRPPWVTMTTCELSVAFLDSASSPPKCVYRSYSMFSPTSNSVMAPLARLALTCENVWKCRYFIISADEMMYSTVDMVYFDQNHENNDFYVTSPAACMSNQDDLWALGGVFGQR